MVTMRINELIWIMDHREDLSSEDYKKLESYDLFNQYDNGEITQSADEMIEVMKLVIDIYDRYTR